MTSEQRWIERIRRGSSPMAPFPTELAPRLTTLDGIRAVLFDIYGTLVISGSGDVGSADSLGRDDVLRAAVEECGARWTGPAEGGDALLRATIGRHHQRLRGPDAPFPEVDICAVWRDLAAELRRRDWLDGELEPIEDVVIAHEVRANPVWPMPAAGETLLRLGGALRLGVVSNAQFYTPLLFPALVQRKLEELGVAAADQHFSYRCGRAKPDEWMYRQAAAVLALDGIEPHQALFVGNDMLNDVAAAAAAGMRTALFAGDRRSLRRRESDDRATAEPDLIINHLGQLGDCLAVPA